MRKSAVALVLSDIVDLIYDVSGENFDLNGSVATIGNIISRRNYSRDENKEIMDMLLRTLADDYVAIDGKSMAR